MRIFLLSDLIISDDVLHMKRANLAGTRRMLFLSRQVALPTFCHSVPTVQISSNCDKSKDFNNEEQKQMKPQKQYAKMRG